VIWAPRSTIPSHSRGASKKKATYFVLDQFTLHISSTEANLGFVIANMNTKFANFNRHGE